MSLTTNRNGASLIEVLLAVTIACGVVASISLFFPKAAADITRGRHRWLANNLSSSQMHQLKSLPYDYIPVNPVGDFSVGSNCDCSKDTYAKMPIVSTTTVHGIPYILKTCVNLAEYNVSGSSWTSRCSDGTTVTDKGIKFLRIRVFWRYSGQSYDTDSKSLANR